LKFTIVGVSLKLAYDKQEIGWIWTHMQKEVSTMMEGSSGSQRKNRRKAIQSLFVTMFFCGYQSPFFYFD